MYKPTVLLSLLIAASAVVPFKNRSEKGNYQLKIKSLKAAEVLLDRLPALQNKCSSPTSSLRLYCNNITPKESVNLLQYDDLLDYIDRMETILAETLSKTSSKRFSKRSVPWNLDRVNQQSGVLDNSFLDDADVEVYILGSGIKADHVEFENRASNGYPSVESTDCQGSGTELASLVGGRTMGIARKAKLIGVQVMNCEGSTNIAEILNGIDYIERSILRSSNRAVVLVAFTIHRLENDINSKLVSLTELNYGSNSGVLVIAGAGDDDDLDACHSTPASAQGATALNGVVTVGGTDENDATISNIGECVDLFAPGYNVPAAGINDVTAKTLCSGSLCAAALAAGVIADSLRQNSKVDLEVQKSMLINGAVVTPLTLPPDHGEFRITTLKAQTPQKLLYHACGYYKNPQQPTCESYTASCNNSKVTTFDDNNVPLYQQKYEKCGFHVFKSEENGVDVEGFYHKCTLGAYKITWQGETIALLPGPKVHVQNTWMRRDEISYESDTMTIKHVLTEGESSREPLIVISLIKDGAEEVHMDFDGTSRLRITIVRFEKYSGKTGGLCGLYDNDGTNDYFLPDGRELSSYDRSYHEGWMISQDSQCRSTDTCEDALCTQRAEQFCSQHFNGASSECLRGVNVYKERLACIEEVSKCCCQEKQDGNSNPDLGAVCCQNSYFGNFERNRNACNFCSDPKCIKEQTHEHCTDNANGTTIFDYLDKVNYSPKDCCYFIPKHNEQICTAPRNQDMMWNKKVPTCQEKTCARPAVPNDQTIISPDKSEYNCGETVTVTCMTCHKINPEPQVIECRPGNEEDNNDADWTENVDACKIITCPEPRLPDVDDDKGVSYPLSWIQSPVPHGLECGDSVTFDCDICYDMHPEAARTVECEENGRWQDSPRCRLRYCDRPDEDEPLEYPLVIRDMTTACNDTIEYFCKTDGIRPAGDECYDLVGENTSTCRVDDDLSIGWDSDRPDCRIRHCPPLKKEDLNGEGYYKYLRTGQPSEEYEKIILTDLSSNSPTECGSVVTVVCDECHYLCGEETRTCQADRTWGEERPLCQIRRCRKPRIDANTANAIIAAPVQSIYDCGETVTFTCKDNCYEYHDGSEVHTCKPELPEEYNPWDSRTSWDGEPYSCQIKHCPALDDIENGSITTTDTTCGTIVKFSCDECYQLEGESEIECGPEKTWSELAPRCIKKECATPRAPRNGVARVDSSKCGATVDYSCDNCYYLTGHNSSTCQDDRSWSNPAPECELYSCPKRGDPENGYISNAYYNLCGDTVDYTCETCFKLIGATSASCQHGGLWNNEPPRCKIKTCARPSVPTSTKISPNKEEYNCGEYFTVKCDACFELEAVDIHCVENAQGEAVWEREVPACSIKECQFPELPGMWNITESYGLEEGEELSSIVESPAELSSGRSCGSSIEYKCNDCYNLRGNKTVQCQEDETWTNVPVCELKICTKPEELTDHLVLDPVKELYSCKQPISYKCDDECWELEGPEQRACRPVAGTNETEWYPRIPPTCHIKECLPLVVEDPLLSYGPAFTCGSTVNFRCPPCFQLTGSQSATCTADSEWHFSGASPQCVPVCCDNLPVVRSGDPSYDVVTMSYSFTHAGDEEQQNTCGGNHVCQRVDVTCQECYEYRNQEGDVLSSAPSRTCQKPGNWTNLEETCSRKSCPARTLTRDQHIRYKSAGMEDKVLCGNQIELECKECYENTEATFTHECLPSKQWSNPVPTCTLKECAALPFVSEHCTFPGSHSTCGSSRELQCGECYYTDKCAENNPANTAVRCNLDKAWEWKVQKPVVLIKTCDDPPQFDHASMVSQEGEHQCGNVIRYKCNECYELEEPGECNCAELECMGSGSNNCTKGTWQGKPPVCVYKTCEPLPVPDNARVVKRSSGCLEETEFECDVGYELYTGDLKRTCTTGKQWSGSMPECRIKQCTPLDAPENGAISTGDHHYGTVVEFSCHSCFKFPDSMTDASVLQSTTVYPRYHILHCNEYGNWNGSEPVCQRKYCGRPQIPGNANIVIVNNSSLDFSCGDEVYFTCDEGYYHSGGDSSSYCGPDGNWDGEPFQCQVKTCDPPTEIEKGSYSPEIDEIGEFVYQSSITYECKYCHQASQHMTYTCIDFDKSDQQEKGIWEPQTELPVCTRTMCPALTPGDNSALRLQYPRLGGRDCGQIVVVECDTGYDIVGDTNSLMCQTSGTWTSDSVPQCQKRCCRSRSRVSNGAVTQLSDDQCYGSRIEITCNACHELQLPGSTAARNSGTIQTCQSNGQWDEELPYCRLIKCSNSQVFSDGYYTDSSYSGYCGSVRTFMCYNGFELEGESQLTCLDTGRWSGVWPTCRPSYCPADLLNIKNGRHHAKLPFNPDWNSFATTEPAVLPSMSPPVQPDKYPVYTRVDFKCDDGYELIGESSVYCTEDRTWYRNLPRCSAERCEEPPRIEHGFRTWDHVKEGAVVSYQCDRCYTLMGPTRLECFDKEWMPEAPHCQENVCYPPGVEADSYIVNLDSTKTHYSCGEEVRYACAPGFTLHGTRTRMCGEDGRWSGAPPVCADTQCPAIDAPNNGGMRQANGSNYLEFWCDKGYQMAGSGYLLCVKGQWQGVEPTCSKQVCGDPGIPDFGSREGESFEYGDSVTYTCNTGYQMRGSGTITCTHRGEWDYNPPYCVCDECPRLGQPAFGYIRSTEANAYASLVEYVCYAGYDIVGNSTRKCLASGVWSGEEPSCQKRNCTENYGVPVGAQVFSSSGHSFQDVVQIKCPNLKGGWEIRCQSDGTWSGDLPERCDCRTEVRYVPVQKEVQTGSCILGKCTNRGTQIVTVMEERVVSVCD